MSRISFPLLDSVYIFEARSKFQNIVSNDKFLESTLVYGSLERGGKRKRGGIDLKGRETKGREGQYLGLDGQTKRGAVGWLVS